jgi:hypothetical protein
MPKRSKKWFIKVRGSYLPNSWQGWLTYIPYIAYLITAFFVVLGTKGSWVARLITLLVFWWAAVSFMNWLASKKS